MIQTYVYDPGCAAEYRFLDDKGNDMKLDPIHRSIIIALNEAKEPLTIGETVARIKHARKDDVEVWQKPFTDLVNRGFLKTDGFFYSAI